MKILWVKTDFLHPTDRGGQIRTLEMIKRLHRQHEIHYVAYRQPLHPDALGRSGEYASKVYPVDFHVPHRRSFQFAGQLAGNLFSDLPLAVSRYRSTAMQEQISQLLSRERFDSIVCDFVFPAPNFLSLKDCVIFQHNVEAMIWRRHVQHAADPLRRRYFQMQADRMLAYEGRACREAAHVIAVSEEDARAFREMYGVERVSVVPTGVDTEYFAAAEATYFADLTFVGSMDWMPNIDAMRWFVEEILPLIRKRLPETTLGIVGRKPSADLLSLAAGDTSIKVTGTVPDVRPFLWGSAVSIVPLRIGGGTRLKIYEAAAAGLPVISTTVGAEGLGLAAENEILLADSPAEFAECCISLLQDKARRKRIATAALRTVTQNYSWDRVVERFESILQGCPV